MTKSTTTRDRVATPAGGVLQLAVFRIAEREYALDIMRIKEIIRPLPITPVPKAPPFIEGVVELRGAIIPMLDLRKRFDAPAGPVGRASKYIVVGVDGRIIGLIVDAVTEVIRVQRDEVRAAPAMLAAEEAQFFLGVYLRDGRILMIVNLMKLLSSRERSSLWEKSAPLDPAQAAALSAADVGVLPSVGLTAGASPVASSLPGLPGLPALPGLPYGPGRGGRQG